MRRSGRRRDGRRRRAPTEMRGDEKEGWLGWPGRGVRALWDFLWTESAPLDLRLVGRTLAHALLVGALAGLAGAAFFAGLELAQRLLLEDLGGLHLLRADGERFLHPGTSRSLRPWALVLLPALGALASGLLTSLVAPEAGGGGGDATIDAYHRQGGVIRRRVIPVKAAASLLALGCGGSGGREGPAMHIGGAIGSLLGRLLPTGARERRLLMVAGVAAGIAAVFRTPLGAALLAVEMLYRDDFESEALVPAILSAVVAYAVVISLYGETTLFGPMPRFPFRPSHLPLYGLLALAEAGAGLSFAAALRGARRLAERSRLPPWARPALGGLVLGAGATALLLWLGGGPRSSPAAGVLGGGYGLAQLAVTGAPGLPQGWRLVELLLLLAAAKLAASALTIGSGASAGDFAPSLVVGGLVGGAFGHAASLLLGDPSVQPGAFALVGMGTFYGGVAHVPLSALVLVSELAGSYDLLVPMMLASAIALVALRRRTLYPAQPGARRDSPVHREPRLPAAGLRARDLMVPVEVDGFPPSARAAALWAAAGRCQRQQVLPVLGGGGEPRGLVDLDPRLMAPSQELDWALAADLMVPFASVAPGADLAEVARALSERGLRQVPVVEGGRILGYVGEGEIARAWLAAPDAGGPEGPAR